MSFTGSLYAEPTARGSLEGARAVVFLVGGYDASANYGDIAQYAAAAKVVAEAAPDAAIVPVLEAAHEATHYELSRVPLEPVAAVPFWFSSDPLVDDLTGFVQAELPRSATATAVYLYGGGYLNEDWGIRKVAHLAAVEDVASRARLELATIVSSGLQIQDGWVESIDPAARNLLARMDSVGVRDRASGGAIAPLGLPVRETGDDVVGIADRLPPAARPPEADQVNVHVSAWGWVTDDPVGLFPFVADVVTELAAGGAAVQPVIAYDDPRTSEFGPARELTDLCVARGVDAAAIADPIVLRPNDVERWVDRLAPASVTVSCSYHVALTSLLLGIPAVLVAANSYYRQKSAGLRMDFALPDFFAIAPGDDARTAARRIAGELRRPELREGVLRGREDAVRRRAEAEDHVRDRLRAALEPLRASGEEGDRGGGDAVELASLRADHAELARAAEVMRSRTHHLRRQLDAERTRRIAEERRAEEIWEGKLWAESELETARAQRDELDAGLTRVEAERARLQSVVDAVRASNSWRLTAPIRGLGSRMRARLGRGRQPR